MKLNIKNNSFQNQMQNTVLYNIRTKVLKYKIIEYNGGSRHISHLSALVHNLYLPSEICHDCKIVCIHLQIFCILPPWLSK